MLSAYADKITLPTNLIKLWQQIRDDFTNIIQGKISNLVV